MFIILIKTIRTPIYKKCSVQFITNNLRQLVSFEEAVQ